MLSSLYTAATGMLGQQQGMDIVANNLANANTNGFKKNQASFADLLYQTFPTGAGDTIQVGRGSQVISSNKIFDQGVLQQTGNSLDMAIEGDGFFTIQMPDGRFAYTRDAHFNVDAMGRIVNSNGGRLYPQMTIPANAKSVEIGANGAVTAVLANGTRSALGQVQLASFPNSEGLSAGGDNLFFETEASGRPVLGEAGQDGRGFLRQGFVERANVNVVDEMVQMIITQRTYELNSRVIQTSDNMLNTAINLRS